MAIKGSRYRKNRYATVVKHVEDIPGIPSKYIFWYPTHLKKYPNASYVLTARVSGRDQHRKGKINAQCWNLWDAASTDGGRLIKGFKEVGAGWEKVSKRRIMKAAKYAKMHNACLLAESVARLLRSVNYSFHDQDKQPTDAELKSFVDELDVPIATYLHPDASPEETRAFETKRGLRYTQAKSGRPKKLKPGHKKKRREELRPVVLKLHDEGNSYRQIEAKTGVKVSTAREWILAHVNAVRILKNVHGGKISTD